jgi:hypothetical protein
VPLTQIKLRNNSAMMLTESRQVLSAMSRSAFGKPPTSINTFIIDITDHSHNGPTRKRGNESDETARIYIIK